MEQGATLIYYTCLTHDEKIEIACREQLEKASGGLPIVSVSRGQPIDFGGKNVVVDGERSPKTMHLQVFAGLEQAKSKYVFLCESDVLYHPSHFLFRPPSERTFFYNVNVWKWHTDMKKFTWTDDLQQVSACCVDRQLAIQFYKRRLLEMTDHFDGHYEAGPKTGEHAESWMSEFPNICIRHDQNITKTKKSPDDFKNKEYAKGWKESTIIPGWGYTGLLTI